MNIVGWVHIKHHYFPVISWQFTKFLEKLFPIPSRHLFLRTRKSSCSHLEFWELEKLRHFFIISRHSRNLRQEKECKKEIKEETDRRLDRKTIKALKKFSVFLKFCREQIIENTFFVSKFEMITKYFPFLFPKIRRGKWRSLVHILLFHYTEQSIIEKWQSVTKWRAPEK